MMTQNNDKAPTTEHDANAPQKELGLAGRMAQAFIHSPLSPLLFFAMLAMGILGLIFTPRQEDPQISVPMVDIFVNYTGASSEQVATLVVDPLERIMSEIPGVKHVYSASRHGEGMVTVQFKVGESLGPSIVKVHDKIQSNMDKIPPGVSMPLVKPKGIDDVPVVTFTLWSDEVDDGILRTLALDLLQDLKQIPNTGQGFIVGGRAEQVRVEVLPERLAGYGLTLDQVANTIRTANSEQQAGSIESGNRHFTVNTGAFLRSAEDVSRLVVTTQQGVPVYVRDVATVFQGPEETSKLVQYYTGPAYPGEALADGAPAVTLAIAKKEGTNGVTVANDIIAKAESLKGRLIPDNVNIEITRNYGETANDKVNELILKLFIATAAVGVLILYFLGGRPAIVVLLVIPVVILLTVFAAWIMGYTIDRVSLFALIFSIGILVDDAIVVIENIYRRWLEKGQMDTATAVDAVREVGNPTILATFTVIAALLPMGFVSGMMGPYMEPIPALGSAAMFFSLIAAFIFTPWLAMRLRPSLAYLKRAEEKEHRSNEKLEKTFRKILLPIIGNRRLGWATLGLIIFAFFLSCSFFYFKWVTVKMLPLDNKPEFSVVIDMPEGTALPVTANITARMAEVVRDIEEVTALQSYTGTAAPFDFNGMVRHYYLRREPWQGEIHVQLLHKSERERSSHEIAVETREKLTPMVREQGGRITVVEMPPGPPVLQAMVAEIYGPDADTRREVATRMTEAFERAEGVADVDNYMPESYQLWRFEVDTEKAVRRGISVDTINRNLAMAMGNHRLGDVKQGTVLEPTYIVLQVPLSIRAETARLKDLPIMSADGTIIPLAELGRFVQVEQDPVIYHKDLRAVEYVVGEAVGDYAAPIYGMFEVEALLADYVTPDGVKLAGEYLGPPEDNGHTAFEWTGEWTVTYETFRDMGAAFAVALILIYILVVWEFGNFIVPAVIMAPIPLTLIGIIPGHMILGAEFTATSMIGFIALAGIIVRNSILLVDFSINQVKQGTDVRDAVVLACKTRTRPIVITALALVLGSFVILFDPIFQGMAISLLFGVLVSTLLTLVVIPLGCISARAVFCPAGEGGVSCANGIENCQQEQSRNGPGLGVLTLKGANALGTMVNRTIDNLMTLLAWLAFTLAERWKARRQQQAVSAPATAEEPPPSASAPKETSADDSGSVMSEAEAPAATVTEERASPGAAEKGAAEEGAVTSAADETAVADEGDAEEAAAEPMSPPQAVPQATAARSDEPAAEEKSVEVTEHPESQGAESSPEVKTASTATARKKPATKKVTGKKAAPKKASAKKRTVKKSATVKKKAVVKKKIALKKEVEQAETAKEKPSVAIKKGVSKKAGAKSKRRGIRLKKNIEDDFEL
jgi:multidrug efflux pump subunit AcrB